jgi:hypothetical protein
MTPCQLLVLIMSSTRQSIVLVLICKTSCDDYLPIVLHNLTKHKHQTTRKHHKFKFIKINIYKLLTPLDEEVLHVKVSETKVQSFVMLINTRSLTSTLSFPL